MTAKWITAAAMTGFILTACATAQENPNYKYSTKYKGETSPVSYASHTQSPAVVTHASTATTYASTSASTTNHKCLNKETNRELIGGALGGTVGAIAGKKIIGGTKGTIVGAVVGGAAGYGIADKTIDCDPLPTASHSTTTVHTLPDTVTHGDQATYGGTVAAPITAPAPTQSVPYETTPYETVAAPAPITAPTDSQYGGQEVSGTPGYEAIHGTPQMIAQAPTPENAVQTISGPVYAASVLSGQAVEYDYSDNMISANTPAIAVPAPETRIIGRSASQGYSVKQGDTVYSLARRLCVGVGEIQSANGLNASYAIQIGQSLQLPASRC